MAADTHRYLQQLSAHTDVASAWVTGGTLRFRIKDLDRVFRIGSIFTPVNDAVANAKNQ